MKSNTLTSIIHKELSISSLSWRQSITVEEDAKISWAKNRIAFNEITGCKRCLLRELWSKLDHGLSLEMRNCSSLQTKPKSWCSFVHTFWDPFWAWLKQCPNCGVLESEERYRPFDSTITFRQYVSWRYHVWSMFLWSQRNNNSWDCLFHGE